MPIDHFRFFMAKRNLSLLAFLLLFIPAGQAASTTQLYAITKGQRYAQTNANPPVLQISPQAPYRARALLFATATTTASVKTLNNTTYNLVLVGDHLEFSKDYTVFNAMNGEWPPGNFTYTITSASDGTKSSVMNLSSDFYPSAPRISNFAEAQMILASQNFTLTWDSLQRPAMDFAYLRIEQNGALVFETSPIPGAVGALNGFATSVTIPANRLSAGKVYTATLTSWHAIARDTTTIPGAQGQTAYTAETTFPLRTRFATLDVRQYGFEKRVNYEQTIGAPMLRANGYELIAFANGAKSNAITAANYKVPAGSQRQLTADGADYFSVQTFSSSALMDGAGLYEMALATSNNGNQTNRLNFSASDFPGTLQIANIDQAQYVKPAAAFTLSWTSPDGNANDLMHFVLWDGAVKLIDTPSIFGAPSVVNGSARSIQIPAGMLAAGKSYIATLRIFRPLVTDTFSYPQSVGVAGYSRLVRFPINTASGPTPMPTLELPRRVGSQTELRFYSIRGETYRIQKSSALADWITAHTLIASDSTMTFLLPTSNNDFEFYRVIAGP
jgi:hypothetical protein